MDFQSEKSFGKLRLRAFQPYHQILCMLKHVEDVEDYIHELIGAMHANVSFAETFCQFNFEALDGRNVLRKDGFVLGFFLEGGHFQLKSSCFGCIF